MNPDLVNQLRAELQAFSRLNASTKLKRITDAYNRILGIGQAIMLSSDKPDTYARAWSLLNDEAHNDLAGIQAGKTPALTDVKIQAGSGG